MIEYLISIHAPAKGATIILGTVYLIMFDFNPRSREGSDVQRMCQIGFSFYFNPRSREGSDLDFTSRTLSRPISIHAPAKGATYSAKYIGSTQSISIHAPAKGATLLRQERAESISISIHAPAKGATYRLLVKLN